MVKSEQSVSESEMSFDHEDQTENKIWKLIMWENFVGKRVRCTDVRSSAPNKRESECWNQVSTCHELGAERRQK